MHLTSAKWESDVVAEWRSQVARVQRASRFRTPNDKEVERNCSAGILRNSSEIDPR
jgi:hypothetical protein